MPQDGLPVRVQRLGAAPAGFLALSRGRDGYATPSVTRQALLTLRNQLFGTEPLMSRAALGLVVFGIVAGAVKVSLVAALNRRITRRGKAWHA